MRLKAWALWGLALVSVTSSAAEAGGRERIVVTTIGASPERLKAVADSIAEQILTELGREKRFEVMGASDVTAVLGMEQQKQMLGCADSSSSCLAELSAALGAPWLVTGHLAELGGTLRLDIKLIRARDGKAVFRDGKSIKDQAAVFDLVSGIVARLEESLQLEREGAPGGAEAAGQVAAGGVEAKGGGFWWGVGAGAVLVLGGGALGLAGASQRSDTLGVLRNDPTQTGPADLLTYPDAKARLSSANGMMVGGGAVAAAGAVVLVGNVLWHVLGKGPNEVAPIVSVGPGVAIVQVEGAF